MSNSKDLKLSPDDIIFTQDKVALYFQNTGRKLNEVCEELSKDIKKVDSFPHIKVVRDIDNVYHSLDNRRLYVFRVLNKLGLLNKITVKEVNTFGNREVTTKNSGCHVKLRGNGVTYRHCDCDEGEKFCLPDWGKKDQLCRTSQPQNPSSSFKKMAKNNQKQQVEEKLSNGFDSNEEVNRAGPSTSEPTMEANPRNESESWVTQTFQSFSSCIFGS